jgi:hypothetical protein
MMIMLCVLCVILWDTLCLVCHFLGHKYTNKHTITILCRNHHLAVALVQTSKKGNKRE